MRKTLYAYGYEVRYEGGRLADVYIDGKAVECVQVREYDFATGEFGAKPTDTEILAQVKEFIDEAGGVGSRRYPYSRPLQNSLDLRPEG